MFGIFYRHSSPDQGNGSLSGMPDSRPGEFSKCGQSLLIVTYYGTWVLMGMGGGGILVLWLCSTCSPVILEVTLSWKLIADFYVLIRSSHFVITINET